MGLVLVDGYVELAEGTGNAPISASNGSCFRDRCSQLISACLPKIGCQSWTRTNTARLNRPACYFDTIWQWRCRQDSHLHRSV